MRMSIKMGWVETAPIRSQWMSFSCAHFSFVNKGKKKKEAFVVFLWFWRFVAGKHLFFVVLKLSTMCDIFNWPLVDCSITVVSVAKYLGKQNVLTRFQIAFQSTSLSQQMKFDFKKFNNCPLKCYIQFQSIDHSCKAAALINCECS